MTDLATMMRDQARAGLQTQLNAAVTEGNTEAAGKIADQIAALAVQTAPKARAYGDAEVRTELGKLDWFGVDPKKSGLALQLGKDMDFNKFPTAQAFAAALVKAVDGEYKPATPPKSDETEDEEEGEEKDETEDEEEGEEKAPAKKARRSDGPGDADAGARAARRQTAEPWTKLSDAPKDIRVEVERAAAKFVPASAAKEQREKYIASALKSHYAAHVRSKGKK